MCETDVMGKLEEILQVINEDNHMKIKAEDSFVDDLILDSIMFIEMILEIERRFSIKIEEEFLFIGGLGTVGDLVDYIMDRVNL